MSHSVSTWVDKLVGGRSPSPALGRVVAVLRADPELAAFATTAQLAAVAQVNIGTVTRAAQFLGFSGWPDLVLDYRGRYLATLTADRILSGSTSGVKGLASIMEDVRALESLGSTLDDTVIEAGAELIGGARRGVVLATGIFAGVAAQLAHGAQLLGCDLSLQTGAVSAQMTAVRQLGPADLVITFNIWKTTEAVNQLALLAAERGVPLLAIVDRSTPVAQRADLAITVPSDSSRYLPSSVPATSVIQALLMGVAERDRARAEASLREADEMWSRVGVVVD
ncbi:MurR/RpiR family transcriptional regulator [Nesterenkonia sandarakina]|uniref:DNA-binding MurR/RpiR family transcriptional regulator n=1 Tax=Nesterenkonia sandarakina TaxID=272918 RepID=A0A7Z0E8S7_9MICC|nr:MurR/RpiR family transcriptional regulator [Nesterenkonia sandarakina]NYJ16735.1 DNA-binding MurR/RpiR family transcriptional regulator [Nesterenkonia sandarakina]